MLAECTAILLVYVHEYIMSMKSCPSLHSDFLYKMGQEFLDIEYWRCVGGCLGLWGGEGGGLADCSGGGKVGAGSPWWDSSPTMAGLPPFSTRSIGLTPSA